jgi:hypothetical protein
MTFLLDVVINYLYCFGMLFFDIRTPPLLMPPEFIVFLSRSCCFSFSIPNRYVRIKRQNQTYFVMCNPDDTVGFLKQQVALAAKDEWKPEQMRMILPKGNTVLKDSDTLKQHEDEIKSESELYVVFQISQGEWESVNIESSQAIVGGDSSNPAS